MDINKKIIKYVIIFTLPMFLILFLIFYLKFNDPDFYIENLSQKMQAELISSGAWSDSCPVKLNRLKMVNIKFKSDESTINKNGQLILLDAVAPEALRLFKKAFKKKIYIDKISLPTEYKNHSQSLSDNNTIGFICDKKDIKNDILNSYGVSLDINPLYNPSLIFLSDKTGNEAYIQVERQSLNFVNRSLKHQKMNENFIELFKNYGFSDWGGIRKYNPNFQYFSVNHVIARLLLIMNERDATKFFKIIINNEDIIHRFNKNEFFLEMKFLYEKNPELFINSFKKSIKKLNKLEDSKFFDLLRKNSK